MIVTLGIMYGPAAAVFLLYVAAAKLVPARRPKVETYDRRPFKD
jgi:hypothetical protein